MVLQDALRGREIYERGASASGSPILATVSDDTRVKGSILPCANCHGRDGKGRPESGVIPPNLSWDVLTKPYRLTNASGRSRPPYDEHLLVRAITMGVDSGGNRLDDGMPRFEMSRSDAKDLVAYLRRLGQDQDPGVTGEEIRIGVFLPSSTPPGGDAAEGVLSAYFDRLNLEGGVFGRHVKLVRARVPDEPSQRADALRRFLNDGQVFAVIADLSGAEQSLAKVLGESEVPALAAFAPFPPLNPESNPYVFYLDGGVAAEERALADFAETELHAAAPAIVAGRDGRAQESGAWLRAYLRERNTGRTEAGRSNVTVWLESRLPSPGALLAQQSVLIPGSIYATNPLLRGFASREVFVAFCGAAQSQGTEGALPESWKRTVSAASLVAEALRSSGRALTRTAFVRSIEGFQGVETELGRPITFGPARRIGVTDSTILRVDKNTGNLVPLPRQGEYYVTK